VADGWFDSAASAKTNMLEYIVRLPYLKLISQHPYVACGQGGSGMKSV